jgi:methyl-accepting chemotaxis protein/methyl-accepting chemotaxis protein-1 (serine sensor receptor)
VNRHTITARIWLSLGIFAIGMIASTGLSQQLATRSEAALRSAARAQFPAVQQSEAAAGGFERTVKHFSDAVVMQDGAKLEAAASEGRPVVAALTAIAALDGLPAERLAEATRLASTTQQFLAAASRVYAEVVAKPTMTPELQTSVRGLALQTDAIKTSLRQLSEQCSADLQLNTLADQSQTQRRIALAISALTFLIAGVVSVFMVRSTNTSLRTALRSLNEGAAQVVAAAAELSTSAQSLSQGASEQAAALEETSASMEEMASMTRASAQHSQQAATLVVGVVEQVDQSNAALNEMIASMDGIKASSSKVAQIIKSIDEIAFQTNLLALNAAVEAARAGQAGMGFAVVAEEVRSLAQRSAGAAKDTASLIDESIRRSNEGAGKVGQVAAAIGMITGSIAKVKTIVADVREASHQQAQGIDQVLQTIQQIERVTQTTAATAEENAAAGEVLNAQAVASMAIVGELEVLVDGETRSNTPETQDLGGAVVPMTARRASAHPSGPASVAMGDAARRRELAAVR